jgi:hypothetical protein
MKEARLKDRIIFNVSKFIDTNDEAHLEQSISDIKSLAKIFRITLKSKGRKTDLKHAWYSFIKNDDGYIRTLPHLYYNLI